MVKPDANRMISFMELLHAFQRIERVYKTPHMERRENDVEHSYLLAMLAWYLIDSLDIDLNKEKVLKYALAHDLVEIYAGDTFAFTSNQSVKSSKHQREEDAHQHIKKEFIEFKDLDTAIEGYERRDDKESVFVYALDKLIPIITNYIQDGRSWKEEDLAFDEVIKYKRGRIGDEPFVRNLLEQMIALIERDRAKYFDR